MPPLATYRWFPKSRIFWRFCDKHRLQIGAFRKLREGWIVHACTRKLPQQSIFDYLLHLHMLHFTHRRCFLKKNDWWFLFWTWNHGFVKNWKFDQKRLCPNWSTPAPATPANDTPSAKHWAFIILNDTPAAKHWASSILDYAPNIQRLAFSV